MNHKISYQNGSVRKRGNKYYYRFRIEEPDGTMKMHESPGTSSRRETEALLKKALDEYNEAGKLIDPGQITVAELMDEWYAAEVEPSTRTSNTRESYKCAMAHIRAHAIGKMRLKDVTVEALQAYVDEKYYGEYDSDGNMIKRAYAESTLKDHFVVLNGIFKFAVYPKEYLRSNLMQFVKKRKKPEKVNLFGADDEKYEIISHQQFHEIESFLSEHHNSFGDNYRYMLLPVQIAYYTGLRAGELCGLTWDDIDIPGRKLTVRRSMYYDRVDSVWELKPPKNGKSRIVDFGDTLAKILTDALSEQEADRANYGNMYQHHYCREENILGRPHHIICSVVPTDDGGISSRVGHGRVLGSKAEAANMVKLEFVCRKSDGELVTTQTLKNCNKLIQNNLPEIPFHMHGLRHTYGSNMVACGANFKDLQALMGHSDIGITLNTYAHVTEQSRKTAVNLLEQTIGN